jgi:NAD(P)-dependent dehydrogenase (short-subunit alcohol dehydrogenase family)
VVLGKHGITSNTVHPGAVAGERMEHLADDLAEVAADEDRRRDRHPSHQAHFPQRSSARRGQPGARDE